jgi:hypothetical protein
MMSLAAVLLLAVVITAPGCDSWGCADADVVVNCDLTDGVLLNPIPEAADLMGTAFAACDLVITHNMLKLAGDSHVPIQDEYKNDAYTGAIDLSTIIGEYDPKDHLFQGRIEFSQAIHDDWTGPGGQKSTADVEYTATGSLGGPVNFQTGPTTVIITYTVHWTGTIHLVSVQGAESTEDDDWDYTYQVQYTVSNLTHPYE